MNLPEHSAYFPLAGEHLFTVLHEVPDPLARVLLVGPFATERHYSYIPWVAWARYLAEHRIECLRFDYRGVGESTGTFEEMSFDHWLADIAALTAWLKDRLPRTKIMLHGLEFGALLAAKAFASGTTDGLLLWAPPTSANLALRTMLARSIAQENLFKPAEHRKPLAEYLRPLENGELLEVDGYHWSPRLWQDSLRFEVPASTTQKPVRSVKLDSRSAPLVKGSAVGYEAIHKDFEALFSENCEWLVQQASH